MTKYKVKHIREECIGCSACAAVAPEHWKMDEEGKSTLVGGKRDDKGSEQKEIDENDLELLKDSALSCPVNIIHIYDEKGKEINLD